MLNRNILIIFLFLLLGNCSSKNELLVDVESFKKQGTEIFFDDDLKNSKNEVYKLKSIDNYRLINSIKWLQENYQSSNFLPHIVYNGKASTKKKKKSFSVVSKNNYINNILSIKNNIFYVDDLSNIFSLDYDLNLVKKKTIYNKNYFQDYLLKFSLVSDGKFLFIADNLGNIHSYDPNLNKLMWSNKLGVPFISNLVFYKNNLFVINDNGKIYSFDSKTGIKNWSYETTTNILKNLNSFQISIDNDKLIFTNDLDDLYCIDLKEKKLSWILNIGIGTDANLYENNKLLSLSKIVIKDDEAFFSSNKNQIFSININKGDINWIKILPSPSTVTPLITKNNLINFTDDGYISILKKKNGEIIFRKNLSKYLQNLNKKNKSKSFTIKNAYILSGFLHIFFDNGYLLKIDTNNLNEILYLKIAESISSFPIVIANNMFFLDDKKFIYKIQ